MLEKIKELEKISRLLEPTPEQKSIADNLVTDYTAAFLDSINEAKAYTISENKGIELRDIPLSNEGKDLDELLSLIKKYVDTPGLNPASGGHLGYIPGGGIYYSALADYLADVTNRYSGVFYASPGAVRMENILVEWMASVIGFPTTSVGNLTSGGSIANLIAIVSAREAKNIKSHNITKSCIYLTKQAHHSVDKAIRIAGLEECPLRYIKVDQNFRMDIVALEEQIIKDKEEGLNPWLIVGSAGTTDTGAIDPLDKIANTCEKYNLWFHVDAAYGGFFILLEKYKYKLKGIDRSDSVVMDPHKGLFLPYGSGAVIIKDHKSVLDAHHYNASYLQDAQDDFGEISPADLSPELTKHFRGLRMWLPLQHLGLEKFKVCLEEKILLANYFYDEVQKIKGFQVGPSPDLSVVIYRFIPANSDPNSFNEKLLKAIVEDGNVFISSTTIEGVFWLRLAVLSFRTHLDFIEKCLNSLKKYSSSILNKQTSV